MIRINGNGPSSNESKPRTGRTLPVPAAALFLSALLLFPGCATFLTGATGAVLLDLAPVGLDLFSLPAKLDLKVANPSKLTVSVSDIKYEVIIDGAVVASGEHKAPVTVAGGEAQIVAVPLSVRPGNVLSGVRSSIATRSVKYQVRGSYSVAATSEQNFNVRSLLKPLTARGGEE